MSKGPKTSIPRAISPAPATESGNSIIDDTLELPHPCVAPIVFVIGYTENAWFAVTGID